MNDINKKFANEDEQRYQLGNDPVSGTEFNMNRLMLSPAVSFT